MDEYQEMHIVEKPIKLYPENKFSLWDKINCQGKGICNMNYISDLVTLRGFHFKNLI
jgi:hypothetical protein